MKFTLITISGMVLTAKAAKREHKAKRLSALIEKLPVEELTEIPEIGMRMQHIPLNDLQELDQNPKKKSRELTHTSQNLDPGTCCSDDGCSTCTTFALDQDYCVQYLSGTHFKKSATECLPFGTCYDNADCTSSYGYSTQEHCFTTHSKPSWKQLGGTTCIVNCNAEPTNAQCLPTPAPTPAPVPVPTLAPVPACNGNHIDARYCSSSMPSYSPPPVDAAPMDAPAPDDEGPGPGQVVPAPVPVPTAAPVRLTAAPAPPSSLSTNTWYIGRVADSVMVTFSDGESAELVIYYNITADKTDETFLKITPMDYTCEDPTGEVITFLPASSEIVSTTDGISLYKAKFDIDEMTIMTSSLYSAATNEIKTCINAELMSGDESVSFVKTKLTIPVELAANFTIASFGAATVEDDNVTEDAVVDYVIDAYKCDGNASIDFNPLPKNTDVRICLVPISTEVKITKILSLTLLQTGTSISRQRIFTTEAGVTRDALTLPDVPLDATRGISVITRVGTEFYADTTKAVTGSGSVQLEFVSGNIRRLAKFNIVNKERNLQDEGPQSSFGVEIGLEADVEEESDSTTMNISASAALVAITSLLAMLIM